MRAIVTKRPGAKSDFRQSLRPALFGGATDFQPAGLVPRSPRRGRSLADRRLRRGRRRRGRLRAVAVRAGRRGRRSRRRRRRLLAGQHQRRARDVGDVLRQAVFLVVVRRFVVGRDLLHDGLLPGRVGLRVRVHVRSGARVGVEDSVLNLRILREHLVVLRLLLVGDRLARREGGLVLVNQLRQFLLVDCAEVRVGRRLALVPAVRLRRLLECRRGVGGRRVEERDALRVVKEAEGLVAVRHNVPLRRGLARLDQFGGVARHGQSVGVQGLVRIGRGRVAQARRREQQQRVEVVRLGVENHVARLEGPRVVLLADGVPAGEVARGNVVLRDPVLDELGYLFVGGVGATAVLGNVVVPRVARGLLLLRRPLVVRKKLLVKSILRVGVCRALRGSGVRRERGQRERRDECGHYYNSR